MPRTSSGLTREIRTIRASFRQLARAFGNIAPYLTPVPAMVDAVKGKRPRRKHRLSRKQRAALKLQGRYMGTMRGLKPRQRAKVKKTRAEKGIRAAIRAAERMAR